MLAALRAADPGATALDDGHRSVAYGELPSLLDLEVEWLQGRGIERCALVADNGVPWVLADLALHVGGLLTVPLPGSFTVAQQAHAVEDAGIDAVLTDDPAHARALLPGWYMDEAAPASRLACFRRRIDASARPLAPRGTSKITYTSGSTAVPKGVCLSAAMLETVAASLACATWSLALERHLCLLPLATLLENVAGVLAPLMRGASCLVPSTHATGMPYGGPDVSRLLAAIASRAPHSLILVPELLQVLVTAAERGWRAPASLLFVAVGGARVSPSLLARAGAAGLPVFEGYGLSECGSVVCLNTPQAQRAGTVGRALPHVRVSVDERGEVHVHGTTMLGYLGDPPRTPDAALATGDLGELDEDGFLRLQGRIGHRLITSYGRNVSPEWIESELSQRLGGVPVLAFGDAQPWIGALVGVPVSACDDAAVARAVAATNDVLPEYAQVRRWVRSPTPFSVGSGTLTTNGRLRRAAIVERHGPLLDSLYAESRAG